jgi:hypothetical protein
MTCEIRKVTKETLGELRGFGPKGKESWWWNESVQSKFIIKRNVLKRGLGIKISNPG